MKNIKQIIPVAISLLFALVLGILIGRASSYSPNGMLDEESSSEENISNNEMEYVDELGYPLPGEDNYEKWYNEKLEKVIAAHNEVDFVYGRILSVEKTDEGQTRVVVSPSKDMDVNHRKNYSFVIRDNTYLRYGFSDFSADDLLVGQRVFVSFASSFEDTLEYSGGERSVAVFSLYVLDDDAANPDPLTPQDYQYYDIEGEVEVEVEVEAEVQTDSEDYVLE